MHGTAQPEPGEIAVVRRLPGGFALWLGLALSLLASLPALVAWAPQMTDYPSHLAGYKIAVDYGLDPFLTRYFTFRWEWTGNLGAELLMVPLSAVFGVEAAGRIVVALIPALTGLAIMAVSMALYRRVGVGAILALCTIWSPSLLMGFLNWSLSLALALLALALWIVMEGKAWRPVVFVLVGFVVWLSHVSGWGVMGVLVFGYEWSRRRSWKDWRPFLAPWPMIFPLLPMLLGLGSNDKVSYGSWVMQYKWGILYKAMRSNIYWLDVTSLCAVLAVLALALLLRRFDARMGWAALLLLVLTLVVPRQIFGGDYADYRLSTTALMVACLAVDLATPVWALALASALFLTRTGVTTVAWHRDAQEARDLIAALDHVPEGARVATAVAIPRSQWKFGPFEHFGSYAVVRRSAMENSNFALPDVHMLSMRDSDYRFADPTQRILYSGGQQIDLRKFRPANHADFLWFIGTVEPVALPDGAHVIYSTEHSFLARLANPVDGG
ncbi:hypothetical protein [Novosphingobium colocasiae]|uniref:hypothetical protein n=1 Tax=Novosphingobium colocasiae TaxID=1256513 RepID=UPI0035B1550F